VWGCAEELCNLLSSPLRHNYNNYAGFVWQAKVLISMEIILIAAMAANRVIGRDGTIPWHIPGELHFFKDTTWGYPLIMGRKTYDSIGRPLPGRRNIVISRQSGLVIAGCEVAASLDAAVKLCGTVEKAFVIGGAQIFKQAMPLADTIILSTLQRSVDGEVIFPKLPEEFSLRSSKSVDEVDPYKIEIYAYDRGRTAGR
jgi:dihydrofolate reductase